jgi:antibiotic biosynthesis monooxygenase (ABM) superfamily enzyme
LLFNFVLAPLLGELTLVTRVLVSTLALTPLMVFLFIPLSTRLLARWLHSTPRSRTRTAESATSR